MDGCSLNALQPICLDESALHFRQGFLRLVGGGEGPCCWGPTTGLSAVHKKLSLVRLSIILNVLNHLHNTLAMWPWQTHDTLFPIVWIVDTRPGTDICIQSLHISLSISLAVHLSLGVPIYRHLSNKHTHSYKDVLKRRGIHTHTHV
jgi:hypothetical protein